MRCQYISYFWMILMVCLFLGDLYICMYIYFTHTHLHIAQISGHYGLRRVQWGGKRRKYFSACKTIYLEAKIWWWHIIGKLWKRKAPVPFLIEHYWGTFLYVVPQFFFFLFFTPALGRKGENKRLGSLKTLNCRLNINIYKNKDCLANFHKS